MTDVSPTGAAVTMTKSGLPRKDMALALLASAILAGLIAAGEYLSLPPAVAALLGVLRLALGLVYIMYLPGYCLTAALFPREDDLDSVERIGLSLGLSVAWVSILVLVLDRLPWGLQLWPIFLGELASILLFSAVAVWRRERLPAEQAYAPELAWRPRPWWQSLPVLEKRIYALCLGALLVAGLSAAWVFLVPSPDEFMTEFYILGEEGLAESYPREAAVGESLSVTMGITNRERDSMVYEVEVWAVDPWEYRRELVGTSGPYELAAGESMEAPLSWSMPWAGSDLQTDFLLYTGDRSSPDPYRSLRLWLNVE